VTRSADARPRTLLAAAAALLTLAGAGAARACVTAVPEMTFEFAPGSAEIDQADRDELAGFLNKAWALSPSPWISLRAFADPPGAPDAKTWAQADLDLAQARARAVTDALILLGGPLPDSTTAGHAPTGAPTRAGADGVLRYGRVGLWMQPPDAGSAPPADGRPVPTC
jgi:hypothetical protein